MYLSYAMLMISTFYIIQPLFETKKYRILSLAAVFAFTSATAITANKRINIFYDRETFFGASNDDDKIKSRLFWEFKCLTYFNFFNQADEIIDFLDRKNLLDEQTLHDIISLNLLLGNYEKVIDYATKYDRFLQKDRDYYDLLSFSYGKINLLKKTSVLPQP
jgi:hypothetical protein